MTPEQTEIFIDTLFDIIASTGAKTNTELEANGWLNSLKIANAIRRLDPELRHVVEDVLKELFAAIRSNVSWVRKHQKLDN